jgi:hypothetical protein
MVDNNLGSAGLPGVCGRDKGQRANPLANPVGVKATAVRGTLTKASGDCIINGSVESGRVEKKDPG